MQESGETYLETILLLKRKNGQVRSIDVARELDYTKPSISRAMGILKEDGFIVIDQGGYIELTDKGEKKAQSIYERHRVLREFLVKTTGVDPKIADQDACRIEHIISIQTFDHIKKYLEEH
ncbi:MAG: metal-dependent transcriptional regulator [Christensenellaceae bacterium]